MKLTNQQKKQVLEEIRQVLVSEKRTHIKNFRLKDKALNRCTGLCTISEVIFRKYFNLNLMRSEIPELSYLYKVWVWHDQDYDSRIKFIDHMLILYSIDLNGTSKQKKSHDHIKKVLEKSNYLHDIARNKTQNAEYLAYYNSK